MSRDLQRKLTKERDERGESKKEREKESRKLSPAEHRLGLPFDPPHVAFTSSFIKPNYEQLAHFSLFCNTVTLGEAC